MEAKDTVMGQDTVAPYIQEVWANEDAIGRFDGRGMWTNEEVMIVTVGCIKRVTKAQAEISFKAGIKEVAEFVEAHLPKSLANYVGFWHLWQAQLKEWGRDDDTDKR